METKQLKQLFRRFLLGHAREKETAAVDNWYRSFDEDPAVSLSREEEDQVREEIWQQVKPQIVVAKTFYLNTLRGRAAAIALLLAGAGLTFFLIKQQRAAKAFVEISTAAGERKTINMEDGTRLVLNAGSTIRIARDLSRERRLQIIDGEVFFDVKGDTRKPFIVESAPLVTTVLGTSFNITAYEGLQKLSIGVLSGKVSVKGNSGPADVLEKDQELVYDRQSRAGKIAMLDEGILEWQQGKLLLNDVSFDEMVVLMQKNFGIHITASQDHVKATRYTTELFTDMEPVKAAEVLAAIHHLEIKVTNGQILIYE